MRASSVSPTQQPAQPTTPPPPQSKPETSPKLPSEGLARRQPSVAGAAQGRSDPGKLRDALQFSQEKSVHGTPHSSEKKNELALRLTPTKQAAGPATNQPMPQWSEVAASPGRLVSVYTPSRGHKRQTSMQLDKLYELENVDRDQTFRCMRSPLFNSPKPPKFSPAGVAFAGQASPVAAATASLHSVINEPLAQPKVIIGMQEAKDATVVSPGKSSLQQLFPFSDEKNFEYFGHENLEFWSVNSEPAQNMDPETEEMIGVGNVSFCCFYSKPVWIVASIHCDKDLAPDLKTKDVVRMQAEMVGLTQGPTHLVQRMINSKSGEDFFRNNPVSHGTVLNAIQLKDFMEKTVNGGVSANILDKMNLRVDSARVLIYKDEDDYESDSDYAEQNNSPADFDNESLIYSVVIKTAPKQMAEASSSEPA